MKDISENEKITSIKITYKNKQENLEGLARMLFYKTGIQNIEDKNMFFIALLAKNMKNMSLSDALFRAALDRDQALEQFNKERFDTEKIGETIYSVEGWINSRYGENEDDLNK